MIKMLGAFYPITLICQVVRCLRSSCYYRANASNDTRLIDDAAEPRKAQKTENNHQESAKGVSATGIEARTQYQPTTESCSLVLTRIPD